MERFGGCDQDVRRVAELFLPLTGGGVAGANSRREVAELLAHGLGRLNHSLKGVAQVPFDVIVEGLERRDIQDLHTPAFRRTPEPVKACQKRRQCFARTSRRQKKGTFPGTDARPCKSLSVSWASQMAGKPFLNRCQKMAQRRIRFHGSKSLMSVWRPVGFPVGIGGGILGF